MQGTGAEVRDTNVSHDVCYKYTCNLEKRDTTSALSYNSDIYKIIFSKEDGVVN